MELNHDDVTHIAQCIIFNPSIVIDGVENTENIFEHARLSRYSIYQLTGCKDTDDEGKILYGILKKDFDTYWSTKNKAKIIASDPTKNISLYIGLTLDTIETARETTPSKEKNNINLYFIQRMLWPDDQDIINRPAKKIEYEAGYHLFLGLADRMTISFQKNFLNYHVDILFELRDSLDIDLPKIGVEIDEGYDEGHNNYNKDDEKIREEVVKYFDNILYRIPIKRSHTITEIKLIVDKFVKNIIQKADDMLITYNPNISQQELERELLRYNYSNHIISHFLANHSTGDSLFCLRHDIVAESLGYSKTRNYRRFVDLFSGALTKGDKSYIPSQFTVNIDYKIVKLSEISSKDGLVEASTNPSTIDILGRKNNGNAQAQTRIYIFSRSTFHRLCIASQKPKAREIANSFCKMYEILFKYIIASRKQVVIHNRDNKAYEPAVKDRVGVLVKQRVGMTLNNRLQVESDNNQLKYEKFRKKYEIADKLIGENKETIDDLVKKVCESTTKRIEDLDMIEKLNKRVVILEGFKEKYRILVPKYNNYIKDLKNKDQEISRLKKLLEEKPVVRKLLRRKPIPVDPPVYTPADIPQVIIEEKLQHKKIVIKKLLRKPKTVDEKIPEVVVNAEVIIDEKMPEMVVNADVIIPEIIVLDVAAVRDTKYSKPDFVVKTMKELKDICRTSGVGGYSGMKKDALINWMMTKDKIMY
jgi:hypothetical protein